MLNWFKDQVRWFFWFPFRRILQWLPLSTAYALGGLLGTGFALSRIRYRKKIEQELGTLTFAQDYPKTRIRNIARQAMRIRVLNQIDVLLYEKLASIPVDAYTEVDGINHLQEALSQNKGVILVHPHFGNPQLLMAALGYRNFPINQVGRSLQSIKTEADAQSFALPPLTPMVKRILAVSHQLELVLPAKFVYIHQSLLPVFRCLKKNEIVAIAIDGLGGESRVNAVLQGRQLSLSSGPVAIALRTGAVVLPTFVLRTGKKERHKIIIEPPLILRKTGNEPADIEFNTQKIADRISDYLTRYPSQIARLFGNEPAYFAKIESV